MPKFELPGFTLPDAIGPLRPAELPLTLENRKIGVVFESDDRHGIRLGRLVQHEGAQDFAFETAIVGDEGVGRGLWEIRLKIRPINDGDVPISALADAIATPESTHGAVRAFRTTGHTGEPAVLLLWRDVEVRQVDEQIPHQQSERNSLFVVVLVSLADGDLVSRWRCWVGREQGASASIDEVDCPSIYVKGPVAPRPGESHALAQRRTRILIPIAVYIRMTRRYPNTPLWLWARDGNKDSMQTPIEQQQQYTVVYAADPRCVRSYRRMLYVGTEDPTGFLKRYSFEGLQVQTDADTLAYFNWRLTNIPGFEDSLSQDKPATEWRNTYAQPFPVVLGALTAKDDHFWFDVAQYYKDYIRRSGMWESPAEAPHLLRSRVEAPIVLATADPGQSSGLPLFAEFLDILLAIQKGLENPYTSTYHAYMQWQQYQKGGRFDNPSNPLEESFDAGAIGVIRHANNLGIGTSLYHRPVNVRVLLNWGHLLRPDAIGYDRTHQVVLEGTPVEYQIDYGSPAGQTWYLDNVIRRWVTEFGLKGVYFDNFHGGIFYDPPAPLKPTHVAHGGDYETQGRLAYVRGIRSVMREQAATENVPAERFFLIAEGVDEYIAQQYDVANLGYQNYSNQLTLAEDTYLKDVDGGDEDLEGYDVPWAARSMSPPLWAAAHGEWIPIYRQPMPFSNIGLETNTRFHPSKSVFFPGKSYPGLTSEEFIDHFCYIWSLLTVEGVKSSLWFYYARHKSPLWGLDKHGEVMIDWSVDPHGAALVIREFLRMLHGAMKADYLGQFLSVGLMERPLQVDFHSDCVDLAVNPTSAGAKANPEYGLQVNPGAYIHPDRPDSFYPLGFTEHAVPVVEHAVWRNASGELGIVLVNWSGSTGRWAGVFDSKLYGFEAGERYKVSELTIHGPRISIGEHSDRIAFATGECDFEVPTIAIRAVAARSVRLFLVSRLR